MRKVSSKGRLVNRAGVGDIITIPGKTGKFLVEDARLEGGGSAMFYYPDAWHIYVRRVNSSNQPIASSPRRTFTMNTNCYSNAITGVRVVARMKKVVRWVKVK